MHPTKEYLPFELYFKLSGKVYGSIDLSLPGSPPLLGWQALQGDWSLSVSKPTWG